jgi:hypothetical protein
VGLAAMVRALVALPILLRIADPLTVRIPFIAWLPELSVPLAWAIVLVWFALALLFTIGWRVSVTGTALTVVVAFTFLLDQQAYSNHLYLLAWLVGLMTIADAGAGLNISRSDHGIVRWPVLLIMGQLSIVYGFSALTKINDAFLSGAVLAGTLHDGLVPFPDAWRSPQILPLLAGVVIVVESSIALLIWRVRFRPFVFVLGLLLHVSITLLMSATLELAVFSMLMLGLYPLFLSPETLEVTWSGASARRSVERLRSFDLLRVLQISESGSEPLTLTHHDRVTRNANAHTRILEHLVPWLWVAPLLRVPGVRQIHRWFYLGGDSTADS